MNKVIRYALQGMGYGGVAYLLLMASHMEPTTSTTKSILSILLMSAAIGVVSLIFESDRFSFPVALGLHLGGTLALVMAMLFYNGWQFVLVMRGTFWIVFFLVYAGIWAAVTLEQHLRVTKINRAIAERNKNKA
ncbi:DUF3021 domain-containing protein [Levilactobacillus parabrevis]|uniref:DUF3021 domain-containing protein n=1 Tax=Levilactobacillus parabrevis TaxID=357278 RepID=UPI0021A4EA7C|nr:DUF3021 domain-containing protein [Levilactobacillus parabrevis]MCT4487893.1 DUF3021 domain-containing protein [Levilactobacillus parabrevis]MCT4491241.1 DUF3021 domain-containing protein [Levilactobacillus parabrevis]